MSTTEASLTTYADSQPNDSYDNDAGVEVRNPSAELDEIETRGIDIVAEAWKIHGMLAIAQDRGIDVDTHAIHTFFDKYADVLVQLQGDMLKINSSIRSQGVAVTAEELNEKLAPSHDDGSGSSALARWVKMSADSRLSTTEHNL